MDWVTVRNFGRVRYFNLSYVVLASVPLLAEGCRLLRSAEELQGYVPVPAFPRTIQLLFGASLLYGLAIALYQYFCPAVVKLHETEEDYVKAVQDIYERAYPDKMYEIVISNLAGIQSSVREELSSLRATIDSPQTGDDTRQSAERELRDRLLLLYPSCVQRYLVNTFRTGRRDRPLLASAAALLYIVATGILLYLLLERSAVVFDWTR